MKFYGDVDFNSSNLQELKIQPVSALPSDPQPGALVILLTTGIIYICATIDGPTGCPVWVPLNESSQYTTYSQSSASTLWSFRINRDIDNTDQVRFYNTSAVELTPTNVSMSNLIVGNLTVTDIVATFSVSTIGFAVVILPGSPTQGTEIDLSIRNATDTVVATSITGFKFTNGTVAMNGTVCEITSPASGRWWWHIVNNNNDTNNRHSSNVGKF